ncbi:Autotransporter-associated beta strand repeat-containing protein [Bosea sp. 29B]|nr:Autotransporter-associated beta strand repeat-containing protein [Bosea sp. 29B]
MEADVQMDVQLDVATRGGGGGGLVLTGAGVAMNTNGFAVSGGGGAGGGIGAGAGAGGAGLVLLGGGTITVAAGAGGTSVIAGGQGGDDYESGHGGAGLFLYNGGSLSHQAGSISGGAGGTGAWAGSGGAGVLSNLGIIDNRAAITGGKGGDSNAGGTGYGRGGAGLEAWGGSIANMVGGSITGGAGGNQSDLNPVYVAGVGGAGIVFRDGQTASLDNAGTISGGNGGTAASSSHGAGGVGIVGAASGGISIVNSGAIAGGLAGNGATRANAVEFYGSNNRFEIRAGSRTDGNVVVQGGGTNSVLALGGTANGTVNIGNLVASHTGFTAYEKTGSSTWTLSGSGSQHWSIRDGTLSGNSSSMAGDLTFATGAGTRGVIFNEGAGGSYSGTISGDGSFTLRGGGSLTLVNAQSYTGATTVAAGTLIVNGSIAASSGVTVAAGATLGGTGVIPTTVVNGTLSPGNSVGTLTVQGGVTFNAGSTYRVEIVGATSDLLTVSGSASLAGTIQLVAGGGSYSFNTAYTVLSAASVSGSFGTVSTEGSFGDGVTTTVSYTSNDVQVTLTPKRLTPSNPADNSPTTPSGPSFIGPTGPSNAYAVGKAIDQAVESGGDPSSLFAIYNLPAASIAAAVNSLSGEVHTAAPAMAHIASDQFLRVMLDQTATGRLGADAPGPGGASYSGFARKDADQSAASSRLDAPLYSVWGAAYGSYGRTDGNAHIGSARRNIDDAHLATGVDVRLMPGTFAGVAVSGGKARASLPGVLGKIDADVFQAGLYGMTQLGPVKLGAALSYSRLENDVSRSIPVLGSSLASSYATTAWSGRLQASAALLSWNGLSLSPLAAIQGTRAHSPAVIEANWGGANAGALALARRNDITARGELGVQVDSDTALGGVPITGYVRAAWAHYFRRDADLTASLAGLPGAVFTATGAEPDRNSALVSAGVVAKLSDRFSLGLNLDGELSANSSRIGGSVQIRVSF